jgi:hypothetical protein
MQSKQNRGTLGGSIGMALAVVVGILSSSAGVAAAELNLNTSIDVTTVTANPPTNDGLGYAAVGFDGTNYWVAKWASDTISRITPAGVLVDTFTIPGLTGTRSFTWDGSNLWAGNSTTTIYCIDPATKALCTSGTTTVPGPASGARYVSWDPTADGGVGGFWTGNFNTDIILISMIGTTLATIPAAGLPGGLYGISFDNTTDPGQPFLWLFHQGGTNNCELTAVDVPSGTMRPSTQDLLASAPSLTSGLAGGVFLAQGGIFPTGSSVLALIQGTPNNYLLGFDPAPAYPVQLQQVTIE